VANCTVEKHVVLNLGMVVLNPEDAFVFLQAKKPGCGSQYRDIKVKFRNT
jgi:hypothetical protein